MEVQDIKSIHDIVLAYHKKQKLVDRQGMYYTLICVSDIPNVGIRVIIERGKDRYSYEFNDDFKKLFKIVINYNKENKMEDYINKMIQEHKELVARIQKLHALVYGDAHEQVDATEFANECIQLKAMKVYEEALRARLYNAGVKVMGVDYLVAIDSMEDELEEEVEDGDTPNND